MLCTEMIDIHHNVLDYKTQYLQSTRAKWKKKELQLSTHRLSYLAMLRNLSETFALAMSVCSIRSGINNHT